jgi:hypothetical protein
MRCLVWQDNEGALFSFVRRIGPAALARVVERRYKISTARCGEEKVRRHSGV